MERCKFDAFCKTVLRNEARTHLRDLGRQRKRESEFSALSPSEMDKLCALDEYLSGTVRIAAKIEGRRKEETKVKQPPFHGRELLPLSVIVDAHAGDPLAMEHVLRHYDSYKQTG